MELGKQTIPVPVSSQGLLFVHSRVSPAQQTINVPVTLAEDYNYVMQ